MSRDWGIIGCAYMGREYCKALLSLGITPMVFSRDLASANVTQFQQQFPDLQVRTFADLPDEAANWMVCTSIESHEDICGRLNGRIWCEKPYAHTTDYAANADITVLMNRRYYFWVEEMKQIIASGSIVKIIACIPERSADALITQSIHVIDLLWHLAGPFQSARRIGAASPSFFFSTDDDIAVVVNMNYGAHENFSLRFYANDGVVYEARPIESFSRTEGMEVREPDDAMPLRSYRPVVHNSTWRPTSLKPGLGDLVSDAVNGRASRLPDLAEHQRIHAWMERNML